MDGNNWKNTPVGSLEQFASIAVDGMIVTVYHRAGMRNWSAVTTTSGAANRFLIATATIIINIKEVSKCLY